MSSLKKKSKADFRKVIKFQRVDMEEAEVRQLKF